MDNGEEEVKREKKKKKGKKGKRKKRKTNICACNPRKCNAKIGI